MNLKIKQLKKSFGSSFDLGPIETVWSNNQIIGLLGYNGSGKSTLLDILAGNLFASEGSIYYDDRMMSIETSDLKKILGYLPQKLLLPHWLTGRELLHYAVVIRGVEKDPLDVVKKEIDYWSMRHYIDKPVITLSHGMKKRIGLAIASCHQPKVLILDEPFSGLDILHTYALKKRIRKTIENKGLCIISTHILPYVVELCHQIFVLDKGVLKEPNDFKQLKKEDKLKSIENYFRAMV